MLLSPRAACGEIRPHLGRANSPVGLPSSSRPVQERNKAARRPSYLDDEEEIPERGEAADLTGLLELDPKASARLKAIESAAARVARVKELQQEMGILRAEAARPAGRPRGYDKAREEATDQLAQALAQVQGAEQEASAAQAEQLRLRAELSKGSERLQSAAAGAVAAAGGVAGAVPFVLTDASASPVNKLVLFASYAASCGLFGIVLRYAIRDSWENAQLKQGVVAAFVVAKTSGAASRIIEQSAGFALAEPALWSLVVDQLLKDTITFAAALVALQLAVQRQIVTPSSGPP